MRYVITLIGGGGGGIMQGRRKVGIHYLVSAGRKLIHLKIKTSIQYKNVSLKNIILIIFDLVVCLQLRHM